MNSITVTSKNNDIVKFITSLADKRVREEHSCFITEGMRAAAEAVYEKRAATLIFSQTFYETQIKTRGGTFVNSELPSYILTDRLFQSVSGTKTPQGVLAVCKIVKHNMQEMLRQEHRLLLLEDVQDPGNMGTVIRTAAAAGFAGIIASKGCVDAYNPKVVRSTAGCLFKVKLIQCGGDIINVADEIKHTGFTVYAAHPRGGRELFKTHFTEKICIAIGNEARGLSERMLKACDELITIRMREGVESLNASVAAALMMYEAVRNE